MATRVLKRRANTKPPQGNNDVDALLQNILPIAKWPVALTASAGLVALAAWVALHWLPAARLLVVRIAIGAARVVVGFVAVRLLLAALGHVLLLQTPWDLSLLALTAVVAVESVIALYSLERKSLTPMQGRLIVLLRAAAVLALALVLIEPTFSRSLHHPNERFVAVLLDDSTSIDRADPQATLAERIAWAQLVSGRKLPAPAASDAADPAAAAATEENYLNSLSPDDRQLVDQAAALPRRKVGAAAFTPDTKNKKAGDKSLLATLKDRYSVKIYRFAGETRETPFDAWQAGTPAAGAKEPAKSPVNERETTDLATALARVQTEIPLDRLAGIIVASDGRHNAVAKIEPVGQRLQAREIAVSSVLLGSPARVADAAIRTASAPDRLQLGDRLRVQVNLAAAGLAGQTAEISLKDGDKVIERKEVAIPADDFHTTVELSDTPAAVGLRQYTVAIKPLEGERSTENNSRPLAVQVTDDAVHVLLIDERARWEYRYLRNLFADRDKAVRLQHVLLRPEEIEGAEPKPVVHASATRPAGESEANALPATPEDWALFDVVILGDVSPERFSKEQAEALAKFVEVHGGSLIVVTGANNMPAKFVDSPLAKLLPIQMDAKSTGEPAKPDDSFRLALSPEGEDHLVMQLDTDRDSNRLAWNNVPELQYRTQGFEVPAGPAQILAYAVPLNDSAPWEAANPEENSASGSNLEKLAQQRADYIRRNALVAVQTVGAGRVGLLLFDSSWRLRFKVGDALHHRFWGQILRWATANKLPFGNERVRLGTDKIVYAPGQAPVVRISLRDADRKSLPADGLSVLLQQGDKKIGSAQLSPIKEEPGMYQAKVEPLATEGTYRVSLVAGSSAAPEVAEAVKDVGAEIVAAQPVSAEMLTLSADPKPLTDLAKQTGGIVVAPQDAAQLLARLGQPSGEIVEHQEYPLWRSWPVLFVVVSLVTSEWLLRKRAGLT